MAFTPDPNSFWGKFVLSALDKLLLGVLAGVVGSLVALEFVAYEDAESRAVSFAQLETDMVSDAREDLLAKMSGLIAVTDSLIAFRTAPDATGALRIVVAADAVRRSHWTILVILQSAEVDVEQLAAASVELNSALDGIQENLIGGAFESAGQSKQALLAAHLKYLAAVRAALIDLVEAEMNALEAIHPSTWSWLPWKE